MITRAVCPICNQALREVDTGLRVDSDGINHVVTPDAALFAAGYDFFCEPCQRGWDINGLRQSGHYSVKQLCPRCQHEMQFDLILTDGRGLHASHVESRISAEQIAGYGFFCHNCQRGWTGDEIERLGNAT